MAVEQSAAEQLQNCRNGVSDEVGRTLTIPKLLVQQLMSVTHPPHRPSMPETLATADFCTIPGLPHAGVTMKMGDPPHPQGQMWLPATRSRTHDNILTALLSVRPTGHIMRIYLLLWDSL